MTVPTIIGPMEKSFGITPSSLPATQFDPVRNLNPEVLKTSIPRASKNAPISPSKTNEVSAPAADDSTKHLVATTMHHMHFTLYRCGDVHARSLVSEGLFRDEV